MYTWLLDIRSLPTLLMLADVLVAVRYACVQDTGRAVFWIAKAIYIFAITWLIK